MDIVEAEQREELSEWVVIQTAPIHASTPPDSPILQPCHPRGNTPDNDDDDDEEDSTVSEEEGESSSTVNLSLPWRVIETAKKRLRATGFFFHAVERMRCNNVTRKRVFWSFIGGLVLVSSLVYVKFVRWWRRLQEEKLSFLLSLVREKDQKIKELMLQIGRLNELLSSRRRVRVVRIV